MTLGTKIIALDYEIANNIISNTDLEKILNTSDEWIKTRTGIKSRHVLKNNETSADLGIKVAQKIIKNSNFNPLDIDLIITASSAPEEIYPSISCMIQNAIKAKNAVCFDLKAACSGFIYSLNVAQAFIKSRIYKNILIIATDSTTKFTDWSDRSTCVLFGDGAGGAIVCADENQNDIVGINLLSDGSKQDLITLTIKGSACPLLENKKTENKPFIQMKGKEVYKFVMTQVPPKIEELIEQCNMTSEDIDYFIPHQSNQRMIDALAERLSFDNSKVISNIENYGNMSAASIIVAIKEAIENQKIILPATVLISAFGAGMNAGNAIIKLDKNI